MWRTLIRCGKWLYCRSWIKAKFHYASWFGAGSEPASVMEFGFKFCWTSHWWDGVRTGLFPRRRTTGPAAMWVVQRHEHRDKQNEPAFIDAGVGEQTRRRCRQGAVTLASPWPWHSVMADGGIPPSDNSRRRIRLSSPRHSSVSCESLVVYKSGYWDTSQSQGFISWLTAHLHISPVIGWCPSTRLCILLSLDLWFWIVCICVLWCSRDLCCVVIMSQLFTHILTIIVITPDCSKRLYSGLQPDTSLTL